MSQSLAAGFLFARDAVLGLQVSQLLLLVLGAELRDTNECVSGQDVPAQRPSSERQQPQPAHRRGAHLFRVLGGVVVPAQTEHPVMAQRAGARPGQTQQHRRTGR